MPSGASRTTVTRQVLPRMRHARRAGKPGDLTDPSYMELQDALSQALDRETATGEILWRVGVLGVSPWRMVKSAVAPAQSFALLES
jgi:hypothetical protein